MLHETATTLAPILERLSAAAKRRIQVKAARQLCHQAQQQQAVRSITLSGFIRR